MKQVKLLLMKQVKLLLMGIEGSLVTWAPSW